MTSVADGQRDENLPDDWRWDALSVHFGHVVSKGAVRIGNGATVPVSLVVRDARGIFLGALYRLAPHVSAELLQVESSEIRVESSATTYGPAELRTRIRDWQGRHHLDAPWIALAAHETIMAARTTFGYPDLPEVVMSGFPAGLPLMLSARDMMADVHEGKERDHLMSYDRGRDLEGNQRRRLERLPEGLFRYIPDHMQIYAPVYLEDLKRPEVVIDDAVVEDEGWLGEFDPRTQTVGAAVQRLLPELEVRLRRALEHIAAEDRRLTGAMSPIAYRSARAFEWLVRYQVLGETKAGIARTDRKDRRHIVREIDRAAALIGLTLRQSKGRPRRDSPTKSQTVR